MVLTQTQTIVGRKIKPLSNVFANKLPKCFICKMTSIYKFTLCYPVFQDTNLKLKTKRVSAF